jgi:2-polyprenyl-3-methyl-5-hydroxy-6-metoxy-1,4-benzoquinol methylase
VLGPRIAKQRHLAGLAKQWDAVAAARDRQLRSGHDLSFTHVLMPTLFDLAKTASWRRVLDAGCGSGLLTELLAKRGRTVVGVDMSQGSIDMAKASHTRRENCTYLKTTIKDFAEKNPNSFTLVVGNMLLQGAPGLEETLRALARLLTHNGVLVVSIPHPFFWPIYWKYDRQPWFNYAKEIAIVAPFRISTQRRALGDTTHFHRPLASYVAAIARAGLYIDELVEPIPTGAVARAFPRQWGFPRFLCMKCRVR